jgi:hypothetical protein
LSDTQAAEIRHMSHNVLSSIAEHCPSVMHLENVLQDRFLSDQDLTTVENICSELEEHVEHFPSFVLDTSRIENFADRIVIFEGENLQIRFHLFVPHAGETYLHDHQFSFISYCLQGKYLHKLHAITNDNQECYLLTRQTNGIYSTPVKSGGMYPVNILTHKFEAGQCLYLSGLATHKIEPLGETPVVTIVFRDRRKLKNYATIINHSAVFEDSFNEKAVTITEPIKVNEMISKCQRALSQKCSRVE